MIRCIMAPAALTDSLHVPGLSEVGAKLKPRTVKLRFQSPYRQSQSLSRFFVTYPLNVQSRTACRYAAGRLCNFCSRI